MKPTLEQLYLNPEFFIQKLQEAGITQAHAKIMGLYVILTEYISVKRQYDRSLVERNNTQDRMDTAIAQLIRRGASEKEIRDQKSRRLRNLKPINLSMATYLANIKKYQRFWERKLKGWPELDFDPDLLSKKRPADFIKKYRSKRRWKSKRKFLT